MSSKIMPGRPYRLRVGAGPGRQYRLRARQVRDISLATVTVTEHRAHCCWCACGAVTTPAMPDEIAGSLSSYGPNLRALAVHLLVFRHIPVERTVQPIRDVTGAEVFTGWVASLHPGAVGLVEDSLNLRSGSCWCRDTCLTWLAPTSSPCSLAPRTRFPGRCRCGRCAVALPRRSGPRLALAVRRIPLLHPPTVRCPPDPRTHRRRRGLPTQRWHRQIRRASVGLNTQAVRSGWTGAIASEAMLLYLVALDHGIAAGLLVHPRVEGREQSTPVTSFNACGTTHTPCSASPTTRHVPLTDHCGQRALRPVKTR